MRTTIDIDPEVLSVVKALARRERRSAGAVISDLARRGLTAATATADPASAEASCGFEPIPAGNRVVSEETVEQLRDALGI